MDGKILPRNRRMAERKTSLFKSTNCIWYDSRLSVRSKIGHSMHLIRECNPDSPAEWERFYLESGKEGVRPKEDLSGPENERRIQKDEIDVKHGKTMEELYKISREFREKLHDGGIDITEEQALNFVYIRAVDEAWIGYQRELAAERALKEYCQAHGLECRQASEDNDVKLVVDYEIMHGGKLVCGVQVKGENYKVAVRRNARIRGQDRRLRKLNKVYSEKNHVPVFFLFVKTNLEMSNMDDLSGRIEGEIAGKGDKRLAKTGNEDFSICNAGQEPSDFAWMAAGNRMSEFALVGPEPKQAALATDARRAARWKPFEPDR